MHPYVCKCVSFFINDVKKNIKELQSNPWKKFMNENIEKKNQRYSIKLKNLCEHENWHLQKKKQHIKNYLPLSRCHKLI